MLFSKLTGYVTRLTMALILGLALVGLSPTPAQAQSPVDLELGGEGATSWNIANIKPGDSGTKTVELHNAGSGNGEVTIWISDIEETDSGEDGAVLDNYLLFNLSGEQLSSDITLPATIHELPQSTTDTDQIRINQLYAGETITLVWEWEFPETGEPQNDAQGDSLSFTINYMLEESPSGGSGGGGGGGTPSYQTLTIYILGKATVAKVSPSGEFLSACTATDPDNKNSLEFASGTKVTCVNGTVPRRIEMRLCETPPSPPSGMEMIGPAYDLTGYNSDSAPCSLIFDKPVELSMNYDPEWLPANTSSVVLTCYEEGTGWIELEPVYGSVAQVDEVAALIRHASIFAALAKITVPSPSLIPAKFELSELTINPAQIEVSKPVIISVLIKNTGELEDSYTLTLKINGLIEQSQEVTLAAGESRQVSFTVNKDSPGTYAIAMDGLSGEFIVLAPASSPPEPAEGSFYWWVVLSIASVIAAMVYFLVIRPRRHS